MRQRGPKHRYPDRPAQRFRSQPRGPSSSRSPNFSPRLILRATEMPLRTNQRRLQVAA
jgi:hypothetical protein